MHAYFRSDKFRRDLDDGEVDAVVLGGDCVAWLQSQLQRREDIEAEDPIFEDWGWTLALSVNGTRLWVNVQDWSFEQDQTWHLWLEPRGIVARLVTSRYEAARTRLRRAIDEVLAGDPAIRGLRWSDVGPG